MINQIGYGNIAMSIIPTIRSTDPDIIRHFVLNPGLIQRDNAPAKKAPVASDIKRPAKNSES